MKKLTLIGTKVFSQQIISFALSTGEYEFVGYFDDLAEKGSIINGKPVLGKVEESITLYKLKVFDFIFIGIGYTRFDLREEYYNLLQGKVPFANIVLKSAKVAQNVKLGEGIFVGGGTIIDSNSIIGDNVFIHGGTTIGHNNSVGSHTYISGRFNTAGFCTIGKRCFFGICSCVSDHITICDDVWIGLACVVIKNIKEPGKYMSPAAKLYKIE